VNILLEKAGYLQGLRQAFLDEGFAEAEARKLTKLADYRIAYLKHPQEFEDGFLEELEPEGEKSESAREKIRRWLPWLLAGGATGVMLFTPWGNRRLQDIFGNAETLALKNERRPKPFKTEPIAPVVPEVADAQGQ